MEHLFYYTGLIFWIVMAIGAILSLIAYLGSMLYNWYKDQETFTGGNNVWSFIRLIFQPILIGFYFLYFTVFVSKKRAEKIAKVWDGEDISEFSPIRKAIVRVCFKKASKILNDIPDNKY